MTEDKLPKLAIRPYPIQYVGTWTTRNNVDVTIRPISPEDEQLLVKFHATLSDRTVFLRYLQPMLLQERVVHDRLSRICHCDYDRELALIAETKNGEEREIIAVVRLSKIHGTTEARLSILVTDAMQGSGLGSELVHRAMDVAKREQITRLVATQTPDNQVMLHIFEKLGFKIQKESEDKLATATIEL